MNLRPPFVVRPNVTVRPVAGSVEAARWAALEAARRKAYAPPAPAQRLVYCNGTAGLISAPTGDVGCPLWDFVPDGSGGFTMALLTTVQPRTSAVWLGSQPWYVGGELVNFFRVNYGGRIGWMRDDGGAQLTG